jgi:hypothetical protein
MHFVEYTRDETSLRRSHRTAWSISIDQSTGHQPVISINSISDYFSDSLKLLYMKIRSQFYTKTTQLVFLLSMVIICRRCLLLQVNNKLEYQSLQRNLYT